MMRAYESHHRVTDEHVKGVKDNTDYSSIAVAQLRGAKVRLLIGDQSRAHIIMRVYIYSDDLVAGPRRVRHRADRRGQRGVEQGGRPSLVRDRRERRHDPLRRRSGIVRVHDRAGVPVYSSRYVRIV